MAAVDFSQFAPDAAAPPPKKAKGPVDYSRFIPTKTFDSELDQTLGRGKWKATGDYRSPQREDQLRAEGAGTVAPGRLSNHSRGTPDAPGAHDIVAPGVDPASLTKIPGVKDAFYEGRSGSQGGHIHIDTDQGPVDYSQFMPKPQTAKSKGPVDFSQFAPPAAKPPAPPPQKDPGLIDSIKGSFVGAGKKLASDVAGQIKDPRGGTGFVEGQRRTGQVVGDVAGLALDPFSTAWDRLITKPGGAILNTVDTALAGGQRGVDKARATLASGRGPMWDALRAQDPLPSQERAEKDLNTALFTLGGEEGAAAKAAKLAKGEEAVEGAAKAAPKAKPEAITTDPALPETPRKLRAKGRPGVQEPIEKPEGRGPVVGAEKDPVERVDNALYRLGGNATADKIEAIQALKSVPKEIADPKVQEDLTHAIEQKMVDPNAEIPEHLKAAEEVRKPWAERQRTAVNRISKALADKGMTEDEIKEYLPDQGYVPRRVVGKSPNLDPLDQGSKNPLAIGGKRPGLTKTTGSMKARDQIVFEDEAGNRTFEHRNPTNDEWKPGMEVRHPVTGQRGTVKQATIKEIEGAGALDSKGQPLTYHKNALVNTIDEALKAERVERNLQVLDELTNHLKEEGLAHRNEWRFKGDDGLTNVVRANRPAPEGFEELHHIPQLKGWSFSPEVAEVLKDYYPEKGEPIDNVISTINRALNASLFVTPFPHIKNVGTMGFIGRGWDWIPGSGNYGRMMKSGAKAIKEVVTLGPKYREHLREGSGLMAGDDATRNFHEAMLNMAAKGVMSNPERVGRALGMNPVDAVKALYNVSHKILWNVNDMILFQRQLELEAKGMSKRDAIKESEKWIANYRVPSQVFKSRAFQQFITDGKWINFGRYTYGKWRAIGEMAKALVKGSPEEQKDALGKVMAAGVATLFIYPMMNAMLQKATGNKNARVPMGGELAPVEAAQDFATGEKDWASAMASFTTPAPLLDIGEEVYNNRELYSGQNIVDPKASPAGKAVQAGEFGAGQFYPAELGMEALKPGGAEAAAGRVFGVSLPARKPGSMKSSTANRIKGMAKHREKNDPVEGLVTRMMGNP